MPPFKKNSPGGNATDDCVCNPPEPAECERLFDDFNRTDSSSLGADWVEVAGDWSIATNRLQVSTSNAFVRWTGTVGSSNGFSMQGIVRGPSGATARVYWNFTTASGLGSTYIAFWEVKFGDYGYMRLGVGDGSSEAFANNQYTRTIPVSADTDHAFDLCVDQRITSCLIDDDEMSIVAWPGGGLSSLTAGLGTGDGSGTVQFDDIRITTAYYSPAAVCPPCVLPLARTCAGIIDYTLPSVWEIILAGFEGDACPCEDLNGPWTVPLYTDPITSNGCEWFLVLPETILLKHTVVFGEPDGCIHRVGIRIFTNSGNLWFVITTFRNLTQDDDVENPNNYHPSTDFIARGVISFHQYWNARGLLGELDLDISGGQQIACDSSSTPTIDVEPGPPVGGGIDFFGCEDVPQTLIATITASTCANLVGIEIELEWDGSVYQGEVELACGETFRIGTFSESGEFSGSMFPNGGGAATATFSGTVLEADVDCDPFSATAEGIALTSGSACCVTAETFDVAIVE